MADSVGPGEGVAVPRPTPEQIRRLEAERQVVDRLLEYMHRPVATIVLIACMVVIHLVVGLVMYTSGRVTLLGVLLAQRGVRLLTRAGAMNTARLDQGELWRLVSAIFLHGSGLHIFFNAIATYALGRLCEAVYGPARFVWLFLLSGMGGFVLSWLGGTPVSVGASGGIFGLLSAAFVFGWRYRAVLPGPAGDFFRQRLLPWIVLNLFIGVVLPFIDNRGHIGGLVTGAVMAMVIGNRVLPRQQGPRAIRVAMAVGSMALIGWAAWGVAGKWM